MIMKIVSSLFFFIFTTSSYAVEKEEEISLKSAVIFNTSCAKCHEGQCSGRLTFDTGSKSATSHITRYSDDTNISQKEIEEFFTLLNYMKKECLLLMPKDKKYSVSSLSSFSTSSHKAYFIPLGILKKGEYSLRITTKEDVRFRLELISSQFDTSLDRSVCSSMKEKLFDFTIDENTNYFLRIKSKKALHIQSLDIKKVD